MDPFHERLARVGLAAAGRYGFALAGGYAVQAAGLLERPSEDVDLFTGWDRRDEFSVAVAAVAQAYHDNSREDLLRLAERADSGFDRRVFAGALGQADVLDPADFGQYGINGRALDDIQSRFAAWRRDLLAQFPPE